MHREVSGRAPGRSGQIAAATSSQFSGLLTFTPLPDHLGKHRPTADELAGSGNEAMVGPVLSSRSGRRIAMSLAIAAAVASWSAAPQARAATEDDALQQAVNYVFTGRIDP